MAWSLKDGVAVITGAASGIGAALALELARRGMHLAVADVQRAGLEATAQRAAALGVRASTHVLDVADRAAVAALPAAVLEQHGKASVLLNNAGVGVGGTFQQVDEADFDWLLSINFHAVVRMTRAFLPVLEREPAAQLVNVSSILGIVAVPGQTAYCASKFAVRGFSESLRHELAMTGSPVGVTLVHPGGVRTAIAESSRRPRGVSDAEVAQQQEAWRRILVLSPEVAARSIADAIERRQPRLLVGQDARRAALLQRLMPVGYWKVMARDLARRTGMAAR